MTSILHICAPVSGHKGLGWNAWHTTALLRERGIAADRCESEQREIIYKIKKHRPRVAVIMALWVELAEMARLAEHCPETVFVVKNHSGPQFLAMEGKSWKLWLDCGTLNRTYGNVRIAAIRPEMVDAVAGLGSPCVLLPNVYSPAELADARAALRRGGDGRWPMADSRWPITDSRANHPGGLPSSNSHLPTSVSCLPSPHSPFHIGLFGAMRPLKNAVGMALAIARAAQQLREDGRVTILHVNQRAEMGSGADLSIITEICSRAGVGLMRHDWLDHVDFKRLAAQMDVCVCASFEETYNYVAADCVTAGAPVVGSPSIYWLPAAQQFNPDNTESLCRAILAAPRWPREPQLKALEDFNAWAVERLLETFAELGVECSRGRVPAAEPQPTETSAPATTAAATANGSG